MKTEQDASDAADAVALEDAEREQERAMQTVAGWAKIQRPARAQMALQLLIECKETQAAKNYLEYPQANWAAQKLEEMFKIVDGVMKYDREHPPK